MKTVWLFPIAAAAVALAESGFPVPDFISPVGAASLSPQELHENTLRNFPSDWILNTTVLEEYILANRGEYGSL